MVVILQEEGQAKEKFPGTELNTVYTGRLFIFTFTYPLIGVLLLVEPSPMFIPKYTMSWSPQ